MTKKEHERLGGDCERDVSFQVRRRQTVLGVIGLSLGLGWGDFNDTEADLFFLLCLFVVLALLPWWWWWTWAHSSGILIGSYDNIWAQRCICLLCHFGELILCCRNSGGSSAEASWRAPGTPGGCDGWGSALFHDSSQDDLITCVFNSDLWGGECKCQTFTTGEAELKIHNSLIA